MYEPTVAPELRCALCTRKPTTKICSLCGQHCCRGCVEDASGQCWSCLGFSGPQEKDGPSVVVPVSNPELRIESHEPVEGQRTLPIATEAQRQLMEQIRQVGRLRQIEDDLAVAYEHLLSRENLGYSSEETGSDHHADDNDLRL